MQASISKTVSWSIQFKSFDNGMTTEIFPFKYLFYFALGFICTLHELNIVELMDALTRCLLETKEYN